MDENSEGIDPDGVLVVILDIPYQERTLEWSGLRRMITQSATYCLLLKGMVRGMNHDVEASFIFRRNCLLQVPRLPIISVFSSSFLILITISCHRDELVRASLLLNSVSLLF